MDTGTAIVVNLVMVQPNGKGTGFGHTESGRCVRFTNDTKAMIALFHELRAAGRESATAPVVADASALQNVESIERDECPIHSLPEIPPGSAVAFAPY